MSKDTKKLIRDLAAISKDIKKEMRTGFKEMAKPTLIAVKGVAGKSSSRIGPATRLQVGFTKSRSGISLVTDKRKAPHARPFEKGGKTGTFGHPVYPGKKPRDQWVWVRQDAHPYMYPTVIAELDDLSGRVLDFVQDIAKKNGFS
jgi:hypothetical protein